MHVFGKKGYECASMQDSVDAIGINRGSLYASFGDKRQLHLEAPDHFYETEITHMMAPLEQVGPKVSAIRKIFEKAAECAYQNGAPRLHDV